MRNPKLFLSKILTYFIKNLRPKDGSFLQKYRLYPVLRKYSALLHPQTNEKSGKISHCGSQRFLWCGIMLLCLFSISFLFPTQAYAYLDPGTGSYIFQLAIGFFLGGLFAIKISWYKIKTFLKNFFFKIKRKKQ